MPKKRIDKHWVFIDLEKLGKSTDTPKIIGSITELVRQKIEHNGEILNYSALRNKLIKNEKVKYWKNDRYIIKECIVERSERK